MTQMENSLGQETPIAFRIAHLSDLHFSSGADKGDPSHVHSIPRLKAIERILSSRKCDRIIISGDLSDAGDRESLLRAHSYIFSKMPIGPHESTGLSLSDSVVGIVPGNHDAFNARFPVTGNSLNDLVEKLSSYRQKSLQNYNSIFLKHKFEDQDGCRYEYIERDGRGIFLVYIDTCYLGDPDTENLSRMERIARGRVARRQSARMHVWFSQGMRGELTSSVDPDKKIPKESFGKCLKILVAHHYLFEPRGYEFERLLQLLHRRGVFTNVAASDFDLYLCGHKHVADFWPSTYGAHFDRRGKTRHLFNLFRRMINIHALPAQFEDDSGRQYSKNLTLLIQLIGLKLKLTQHPKNEDLEEHETIQAQDDDFIERLVSILTEAIADPSKLESAVSKFLKENKIVATDVLERRELEEMERALDINFNKEERKRLEPVAAKIAALARHLGSRPFLQIMSGTAAKRITDKHESPSFNIYTITFSSEETNIRCEKFLWSSNRESFVEVPRVFLHVVEDLHKAILG